MKRAFVDYKQLQILLQQWNKQAKNDKLYNDALSLAKELQAFFDNYKIVVSYKPAMPAKPDESSQAALILGKATLPASLQRFLSSKVTNAKTTSNNRLLAMLLKHQGYQVSIAASAIRVTLKA